MTTRYFLVTCYNHMWWAYLSKVIRFVDGKDSSHCEILQVLEDGTVFFYGSIWPRSRRATFDEFAKHYSITGTIELVPLSHHTDLTTSHYLNNEMGKLYSFVQIILAGLKILLKSVTSIFSSVNVNATKYLICTELCGNFMRDVCGFHFEKPTDLLTISELKRKAKLL